MKCIGRKLRQRYHDIDINYYFFKCEEILPYLTEKQLRMLKRCVEEWIQKKRIGILQNKK